MILKKTTLAARDKVTGLTLKVTETDDGNHYGRALAVNNTFYNAEKGRLLFSKPLLNSFIQTKHIHFNKRLGTWQFPLVEDTIEMALQHAEDNKRIFISYLQMTKDQWKNLDWRTAESMFLKLARRGTPIVPYPIPLDADVNEWDARRKVALQMLNKSQELMPVFCTYHEFSKFILLINKEFYDSKIIGIHYYDILDPTTQSNLNEIYKATYTKKIGSEVPLMVAFGCQRYMRKCSNVSAVYLLGLFGMDVVSYRVMSPEQVSKIEEEGPEHYKFYDSKEGGYNDSGVQTAWYGEDLTREQLSKISVDEGLEPYSANLWADFLKESEDLDLLNNSIIGGTASELISTKSRWDVVKNLLFITK